MFTFFSKRVVIIGLWMWKIIICEGTERVVLFCNRKETAVNPQKIHAGLILSLRVQMWVLLEFAPILDILPIVFPSLLWVLLQCRSYLREGLSRGLRYVCKLYIAYFFKYLEDYVYSRGYFIYSLQDCTRLCLFERLRLLET